MERKYVQMPESGDVIVAADDQRLEKPFVVDHWHRGPDLITIYDLSGTPYTFRAYTLFTVQPRFP